MAGLVLASSSANADHPSQRVLTGDAQVEAMRADPGVQAEAKGLRKQLEPYFKMTYDQLWEVIPPAAQLRAVNVAFNRGCPICGREIFRKGGGNPWILSTDRPFKVQCPVCKRVFPSNDFKPWTTARGQLKADRGYEYFDDGFGYVNERGEPFYFVAYYVFWKLWRGEIPALLRNMSHLYLISGDKEAGRRAVILLARLASEYSKMHYQTQSVHIGKWPSGYAGKILDYVWENGSATHYPAAYDNVRDILDDARAKQFLTTKGIDDPHAYIFKNLLQGIVQAYIDKNIRGNTGWQRYLMFAVRVINNDDPKRGHTTEEMVDWLLYGDGELATLLYNSVTRDGAGSEGTVGYNSGWWDNLTRLAEPMGRLGFDMWRVPPWAPRLKKMSDYYIDYYGSQGAWHGHKDRLNIEYIARDTSYLPEMGYPAHWGDKAYQWTMGTTSHYTVLIDEHGHAGKPPGQLRLLADGRWSRVMEASAPRVYPERATAYRRTVAMIDVGKADSYLLDVFRVTGGRQHDYSFHGLPWAEVTFDGIEFGPARPGTVAGEDVPFGHRPKSDYYGSGYYYLERPRIGKPEGAWRATWNDRRDARCPRSLRLHVPAGVCQELIVAQAEPELAPGHPKRMDWLLLRNRADRSAPAQSTYVGIIEPYVDKPLIERVEPLVPRDTEAARRAGWVGLRVRHREGVDLIFTAVDDTVLIETTDGLRFQGRFGAIRQSADGTSRHYLVNGRLLASDQKTTGGSGPVRSQIARVLYRQNAIELTDAVADPSRLVGRVAIVHRGDHRTSYTVRSATNHDGRTQLGFGDVTCIIGIVQVDFDRSVGADRDTISLLPNQFKTRTRLGGYGIKFAAVPIIGLSAVSESFSVAAPIVARHEGIFSLGNGVPASSFSDADGDGRRMAYLADLSVGEHVMLPAIIDEP